MLHLFLAILIALLSPKEPTLKIETSMKMSCIQLIDSYGTYTYPSIYVTGLPADLEIIFASEMTVYRFQGLNDNAVLAELPIGMYTVIAYYGKEQVSNTYAYEVRDGDTLMIHAYIPQECYPQPSSIDKQG